jgi:hypothetical protein
MNDWPSGFLRGLGKSPPPPEDKTGEKCGRKMKWKYVEKKVKR